MFGTYWLNLYLQTYMKVNDVMRWRLLGGDQWSVLERVWTGSAAVHRSAVEPCQGG